MEEEDVKGIADYLDIIRRRKYWVIFPALILMAASVSVAYMLPKTFKSEGVILIESQEIPNDLVRSTVTSYADQRIAVIKQRIMTTSKVMAIVNQYKLYPESRSKVPPSQIVAMFRNNIDVSMVNANVTDPRSGRTQRSNIAFKVSFMDQSPLIAQQVANELVTQFLDENVRTRTDRAAETKDFLLEEGNKFERKVQLLEKKIAEFKDEYSDSLPELLEYNLSMVERLQQELADNQNQIMVLQDQILTMNLELANIPPYTEDSDQLAPGSQATTSEQQLQLAKTEYSNLSAKYSENHPDVMQLQRQIESLQAELGIDESEVDNLATQLAQAKEKLTQLSQRYSASHPDIKAVQAQIELLQKKLTTAEAKQTKTEDKFTASSPQETRQINPIYLQIKSKVDSSEREIVRLRNRQDDVTNKLADFEKRVFQTHQVQRAYDDLTRDHANNLAKYKELRAKQLEAELGQNLESENKGESFTLIEPPQVPRKAEKPNRPKIMAMGFIVSIGAGLGLALLMEMIKGGVRGYAEITRIVGSAPLVVIPLIATLGDEKIKKMIQKRYILGSFILFVLLIICFHLFVMDLEVLWFKIVRKMALL
jgi:succinoglycan biosynthesis transport protein ExoP